MRTWKLALVAVAALGLGSAVIGAQATSPRFTFGSGANGVTYYAAPRQAAAAQPTTASTPRTVGPNARNWSTGNRVPLHRPWLRARG